MAQPNLTDMFDQLIRQARTHRRFDQSDPIGRDDLVRLVDMARNVPSGGNSQPLRYAVVSDAEECAAVFPFLTWAGALADWDGPTEGEQPTGYIALCSDAAKPNPSCDLGIVLQTIQLGATAMGYAACAMGAIDRDAIHQKLQLPSALALRLIIALGRPGEQVVLEDLPESGSVAYWRDEQSIHHVPKRTLEQVLIR